MSDRETSQVQLAPQQQPVQVVQMAQSVTIQSMPDFCPDAKVGASLATRWINWQSDFEMFLTASGITDANFDQTLDEYHTRLRTNSTTCEFNDTEFEIEQQIIIGGTSSKIPNECCETRSLT